MLGCDVRLLTKRLLKFTLSSKLGLTSGPSKLRESFVPNT